MLKLPIKQNITATWCSNFGRPRQRVGSIRAAVKSIFCFSTTGAISVRFMTAFQFTLSVFAFDNSEKFTTGVSAICLLSISVSRQRFCDGTLRSACCGYRRRQRYRQVYLQRTTPRGSLHCGGRHQHRACNRGGHDPARLVTIPPIEAVILELVAQHPIYHPVLTNQLRKQSAPVNVLPAIRDHFITVFNYHQKKVRKDHLHRKLTTCNL